MATGACGINCDTCRLNLLGLCTTCGSGKSKEAVLKLSTQERILGDTCPILSCACMNRTAYCMRDCAQFPCENFTMRAYPFSRTYLEMQKRRRQEWIPRIDPLGKLIKVPDLYWKELQKRENNLITSVSLAETDALGRFLFKFLDLDLRLDPMGRQMAQKQDDGTYVEVDIPLLLLTCIIYFKTVDRFFPMGKDLISTEDMGGTGNYFTGDHKLKTEHLLNRFSADAKEFDRTVRILGGTPVEMGDCGWVLYPFPRVAVYYLFWDMETDYDTRISILFDRPIREIFAPPVVWELVNLVNARLLSV